MDKNSKFAEIIESIYVTVDKPDTWEQTLQSIAEYSESTHSFYTERKGVNGEPLSFYESGFSPNYFQKYGEYFYQVDIWSQNLARFKPNQFHASHKVCDDHQFVNSEIYADFARPEKIRHSIGLFLGDPYSDVTTEMAFMRSMGQPHYEAQTVRDVNRFIPHIQQVQNLARRLYKLEHKKALLEDLVNHLDEAVFLTNKHFKIEYCNQPAQKLLDCSMLFTGNQDFFRLKQKHHQQQLSGLVNHVLDITNVKRDVNKRHLLITDARQVYLLALSPWVRSNQVLFGDYPELGLKFSLLPVDTRRLPATQDLANMLGLTNAEADIVKRICSTESLAEIAHNRNTQLSTSRQQVKQILQKMDCSRQVELVIKVLGKCLI